VTPARLAGKFAAGPQPPMRLAFGLALIGIAAGHTSAAQAADESERAIAVLERRCVACHGAREPKGGLSLATRSSALSGGESGPSLVPGKPDESLLVQYVSGTRPEMPKDGPPLAAGEVAALRGWIASGARWPAGRPLADRSLADTNWWSLAPLVAPRVPGAADGTSGTGASAPHARAPNPVDAFLDAKLAERGLRPMPPADPLVLLRRMTFDLTGLPPTLEEIAALDRERAASGADAALDAAADRLLASPAFGEKWAQHWLDLARYAETHGYDKDKPRPNAWPYRDYVIRSFSADKPYGRFVEEQIAGDALFPGEAEGVLGLGFLAAGPWDLIGHTEVGEAKVDGRIAKHLDRDEMIAAVFNVFLSTTVQCAQCHHHKFDPVRMEDYYRLHAVFAAVDRADRVYAGLSGDEERARQRIVARTSALRSERNTLDGDLQRKIAARTSSLDRKIAELKAAHGSPPPAQHGWHSAISRSPDATKWVQVDLGAPREVVELRLLPAYDDFNQIGAGFGFPVRYKVEVADDAAFTAGVRLLEDATAADRPNPGDREVIVPVGGGPVRYLRITATRLAPRK